MSPCLEFEGKSVDKAVEIASAELQIPKEKLKYDIISYGSSGIFGLVAVKKAKIKVVMKEKPTAGKKGKGKKPNREKASATDRPTENTKIENDGDDTPVPENGSEIPDTPETDSPNADASVKTDAPEAVGENMDDPEDESEKTDTPENDAPKIDVSEESLELGKTALRKMLDLITPDTELSVETDHERVLFDVRGGNSAVLIGKRGQTLDAIQYLVEKIMNKSSETRIRVQVDIEGYLDNRQTRLKGLASRLATKAKRTGKPVTVGQLNAQDRRIIHLSLRNDNTVRTQSMGDGPFRKLVIFPKKNQKRRRPQKETQTAD